MTNKNQEFRTEYTIQFDDNGKLESILVEEVGRYGRWLYKRQPKGMELPLTEEIFQETVEAYLDKGMVEANKLYKKLRASDKYYADMMLKAYKVYLKAFVLGSNLHQDAFWGE